MILIDTPYFNEYVDGGGARRMGINGLIQYFRPGFGKANPKSSQSISYNEATCLQTVRWATVEWLKEEHRSGIWAVSVLVCLSRHHVMTLARPGRNCLALHHSEAEHP